MDKEIKIFGAAFIFMSLAAYTSAGALGELKSAAQPAAVETVNTAFSLPAQVTRNEEINLQDMIKAEDGVKITSQSGMTYTGGLLINRTFPGHLYNYSMNQCKELEEALKGKLGNDVLESGCYHESTDESDVAAILFEMVVNRPKVSRISRTFSGRVYNYSMNRCLELETSLKNKLGENVRESGCRHKSTEEEGVFTVVFEMTVK